jgi:hypothetical protein
MFFSKKAKKISFSITNAQPALSKDMNSRMIKYSISMGIRTICFLLTVFTPSPYRWGFLVGAVTLPYIAVVLANAGRETVDLPLQNIKTFEIPDSPAKLFDNLDEQRNIE